MTSLNQRMRLLRLCVLAATLTISASAQTYTELLSFNGNSAAGPKTPLTQGIDGSLYGTTYYGGTGTCNSGGIGCGVVFKLTAEGEFKIVYNFPPTNLYPTNDLVLGDDGSLYGTTAAGAVFRVSPTGAFAVLHTFNSQLGGEGLSGGLIQGTDGNFYGTTSSGGRPSNSCPSGCGTVFMMTRAGAVKTLYSFCPQNYCPDGENPVGALAEGLDGNFYGTTQSGGLYKEGTVFKVTPNGGFGLVYTFNQHYNVNPGGLVLATDGNFYGTTSGEFVYRITPAGDFTQLTGWEANLNLIIQGSDGNLYGTTENGGSSGDGIIFSMSLDGSPAETLYSFVGYPDDGANPFSPLVQDTNGKFYGVTYDGGDAPCNYGYAPGCGTVFSISNGLGPFVALVRRAGKVSQQFGILGQGFTGTTSVLVSDIPASFTVTSDTLIQATVPAGATTGYVTVTTPTGTLTSNVPFHVIP
jgi:uncharacterized repeat protein (TIGR03803 family)